MPDVKRTRTCSDRSLIALSLAAFTIAGVANTSLEPGIQSVGAMAVAIFGVYGFARYAKASSREHLAWLSVGLWGLFILIAGVHLVGLGAVGWGPAGLSPDILAATLTGVTWGTLLGATASTAFLGFREYGARQGVESPEEQVLESDLEL